VLSAMWQRNSTPLSTAGRDLRSAPATTFGPKQATP
jgi:hypothetical protein